MKPSEWFKSKILELENDAEFRIESLSIDFTSQICERINELGTTQAELAKVLNKKPSFVARILSGDSNLTIKTMNELALALDCKLNISITCNQERRKGDDTGDK